MTTLERDNGELHRESHTLSVEFLKRSGFKALTDQLVANHRHRGMERTVHGLRFEPWRKEFGGENRVYISLVWNWKVFDDGTNQVKHVEIEFEPNGIILVKGGMQGSSTLLPSSWENRLDIQKQALEKAIQHPIILTTPPNLPPHT